MLYVNGQCPKLWQALTVLPICKIIKVKTILADQNKRVKICSIFRKS